MMLDVWLHALRKVLESQGHHLSDKQIGADYEAFSQSFEEHESENVIAMIEEASAIAESLRLDVRLYPHAATVLRQLHSSGKKLAIVTTSTHAQIDPLLAKHNLTELFNVIICADDTTNIKPDPEPVLKAMTSLGAKPASTLIVGDSENDLKAATSAGIDSALFYPARHELFHDLTYLQSLKPSYVISDLSDLVH